MWGGKSIVVAQKANLAALNSMPVAAPFPPCSIKFPEVD